MGRQSHQSAESGPPTPRTDRASKLHLIAILVITIGVMIAGLLVVTFPEETGVPRATAAPASRAVATPAASDGADAP